MIYASKEISKSFAVRYAVYHHYRSQGWIVKCGLKFGTDFVLYKKGPTHSHSDFAVVIQTIQSDKDRDEEDEGKSWPWALGMLRVCSQVKKQLLLCYVSLPENMESGELYDPEILKRLSIWDAALSRWVPSKTLM